MNTQKNSLPNLNCNIRFINSAGPSKLDIYINKEIFVDDFSFGKVTSYRSIPSGEYLLEIYKAGDKSEVLYSEEAVFKPQSTLTLSIIIIESDLSVFTLTDGFTLKTSENAFLRFINFSPDSPLLTLSLSNEEVIFSGVQYIENTRYVKLKPGLYDFLLTETEAAEGFKKYISSKGLKKGHFYTLYIIGQIYGNPKLGYLFLEDGI